jgi:hypothetical protein
MATINCSPQFAVSALAAIAFVTSSAAPSTLAAPVDIIINEDLIHNEQTVNFSIVDSTILLCQEMTNPTNTGCEQLHVLIPPVSDQIDFEAQGAHQTLIRISSDFEGNEAESESNERQDFADLNEPAEMTPDIIAFVEPDVLPETIKYHPNNGQPGFSPDADITYIITSDPALPEPSSLLLIATSVAILAIATCRKVASRRALNHHLSPAAHQARA